MTPPATPTEAPQPASPSVEPGTIHLPVMMQEVLQLLAPRSGQVYIDATGGGGGHSQALLQATAPDGRVFSLDADPEAVARLQERLRPFRPRATIAHANARSLAAAARQLEFEAVDGVLLDLGLSSDQLNSPNRGFSIAIDGPLDMRFDPSLPLTAADLVNTLSQEELANLIYRNGEERRSRRIARAIIASRPLYTTGELAAVIVRTVGRQGRLHPATRTFQALRIAVNDELGALAEALPQAVSLLRPGGRLAVISFHSLEDRIVKQFMRQEAQDCICPSHQPVCSCQHKATLAIVTRKPIQTSAAETAQNPRSRSARLRVAERLPAHELAQTEGRAE